MYIIQISLEMCDEALIVDFECTQALLFVTSLMFLDYLKHEVSLE